MEKSIIDFIIENIFLFLPLVLIGIGITIYLYFTGKNDNGKKEYVVGNDKIKIGKYNINAYILIYLFLVFMMILIGFLSDDFIIPTIVCTVIASIPIIMMILQKYILKKKVEGK